MHEERKLVIKHMWDDVVSQNIFFRPFDHCTVGCLLNHIKASSYKTRNKSPLQNINSAEQPLKSLSLLDSKPNVGLYRASSIKARTVVL